MSAAQERLEQLFAEAIALAPAERHAFVERASGTDAALRQELSSLLAHHTGDEGFLGEPLPVAVLGRGAHPRRVASYEIEGLLGEGGMGVVYLARQENPAREVALKLIRPGHVTPRLLQRFEREAQLLGRLHHPGIAQIFEAGSAEVEGVSLPFLAMELVRGPSILEHAQRERLGWRARLELLVEVCEAVEHAHRQGVLHRDLKPANVLIDVSSGRARAKVLDFGIARAADDSGAALLTDTGQIVGTLAYMSPEQASGARAGVDERADVYALGVLGYELLTGRLPLDVGLLPLLQAARVIAEEEPAPASRFAPELAGDLETILAKALEKQRARRYGSAAELAEELRCALTDRPIRARPPSRLYRLGKFARRNRALVHGALAVFLALAAGIAATTTKAIEASDERDRARTAFGAADLALAQEKAERVRALGERNRSALVSEYFQNLLAQAVPGEQGPDARLLGVLERAARELPGTLATVPAAEADVRSTLGQAFQRLGRHTEAEAQLRAALELCRHSLADDVLRAADVRAHLGSVLVDLDRCAEAEVLLAEAAVVLEPALGPADERVVELVLKQGLAQLRQQQRDEAERTLRRGLELARGGRGLKQPSVARALGGLGLLLSQSGRLEEAETLQREALALHTELEGELHPGSLNALTNLACTLQLRGRTEEAEALHRQAVDLGLRVQGARHPDQIARVNNLAGLLVERKAYHEALPLRRQTLALAEEELGPEHENTLHARANLALLLAKAGEVEEAETTLREVVGIERERFGPGDPRTLGTLYNLAWLLRERGKLDDALVRYRELVEAAGASLSPDDWQLGLFRGGLGACLLRAGRPAEAEEPLLQAQRDLERLLGAAHTHTRSIRKRLVELYGALGRPEDAERWR